MHFFGNVFCVADGAVSEAFGANGGAYDCQSVCAAA